MRDLADDVTTAGEQAIEEAVVLYLEIEKTVAEGAGAASVGAENSVTPVTRGRRGRADGSGIVV